MQYGCSTQKRLSAAQFSDPPRLQNNLVATPKQSEPEQHLAQKRYSAIQNEAPSKLIHNKNNLVTVHACKRKRFSRHASGSEHAKRFSRQKRLVKPAIMLLSAIVLHQAIMPIVQFLWEIIQEDTQKFKGAFREPLLAFPKYEPV